MFFELNNDVLNFYVGQFKDLKNQTRLSANSLRCFSKKIFLRKENQPLNAHSTMSLNYTPRQPGEPLPAQLNSDVQNSTVKAAPQPTSISQNAADRIQQQKQHHSQHPHHKMRLFMEHLTRNPSSFMSEVRLKKSFHTVL